MSIQSKFSAGLLCLCALYIPCSVADVTGDPSVYATWTDDITQGNWVSKYGSCYSVLPQASPRHCQPEIKIGPDFEGPNPGQYKNVVPVTENCGEIEFPDALCISGDAPNNFDVRLFVKNEAEAYIWGFDDFDCVPTLTDPCAHKVAEHAAQYNGCLSKEAGEDVYYPSTFDDDSFNNQPLSGEIWLDKGGDAIIAYYFLTEATSCRSQSYELFVNDVSIDSGKVTEFNSGQYLVFDIRNIPDDSKVRLETAKLPSDDPDACNLDLAPNSHMSGIFVDGTDACAPPLQITRTKGYWKNHHRVIDGSYGDLPSLVNGEPPLEFCGMNIESACDALYFLRMNGGGLNQFMSQGMAALMNCQAFGCPDKVLEKIAANNSRCADGENTGADGKSWSRIAEKLNRYNNKYKDADLPFESPSATPKAYKECLWFNN